MNISPEEIKKAASSISQKLQEIRHHLHAHPELSFKEYNTSTYLENLLKAEGLDVKNGIAGTGLLVTIKGEQPGPKTALRADMDALPITEKNTHSYKSVNDGIMHACGHDVHMTCLVGALLILNKNRKHLKGTVKALFQPGEEVLPGGASIVLEEGIFNPPPAFILGQHVYPELTVGKVGFREGPYMASTDELYFTVKGKGGHAALPKRNIDPVPLACRLVLELQKVGSIAPEGVPTVLAIGKIQAAGATNVIPDEVTMAGTFRTMNEAWRTQAHQHIHRIAEEVVKNTGASCIVEIKKGYPVLTNDPSVTADLKRKAKEYLGREEVVDLDIRMTAEDFAWYTTKMPGCFYRLGTASPDGSNSGAVHTNTFDIDESALVVGAGLMAWLTISR